jgi:two-component system nitrate/nitrite sensor histidine kinase NarX
VVLGWASLPLVWVIVLVLNLGAAWLAGKWAGLARERGQLRQQLRDKEAQTREVERRLESVVRLNRELVTLDDERSLVETALNVVSTLTGALASSFVPLDEMGEPLSAIVQGSLPQPILKAWAEHLAGRLVRQTCGECQKLHADAGQVCPLLQGPFADAFSVYCLPLNRGQRAYGLLNVYFGPHHQLNPDTRSFLEGLLAELGNALQVIRLRGQEISTLRQIQLARANRTDLSSALGDLLENVRKSFDMDAIWLQVRAGSERQSQVEIHLGDPEWIRTAPVQAFYHQILAKGHVQGINVAPGSVLGAPLILPDGQVTGAVLLFSPETRPVVTHQLAVLQTVAAQAALLIESERSRESLEFAIVIQERTRLAREIHDGLAQTLAYLKLQTAQMQRAFVQKDLDTLKDLLDQNYAALADAYLDTRQVIDNLRLNPQQGMDHWLDQVVREFEHLSGIKVERNFEPATLEVPSEVQAQLIRIVQETFSNIRKHSRARCAWITLREHEGDFVLEVGDDGQGFQPDDVPGLSQYGLRGMRERAELIGADFQIVSRVGAGTVVHLRLPARSWEVYR